MTREEFSNIVCYMRELLSLSSLSGAGMIKLYGLDLGLGEPVMDVEICVDDRTLYCMVRRARTWDKEQHQAMLQVLDAIMPGARYGAVDETLGVRYRDERGCTASVLFNY